MSLKDRTSEFHAAVESIKSWSTNSHGRSNGLVGINKTEFSRMASAIGKDINSTAAKLQKLTNYIAKLNKQIALLQQYVRENKKNNKQADEHSSNVVVMLQSKLANTSMSFKDVLEIRTQNMKESKDRREQFMFSSNQHTNNTPSGDSPLYKTQKRNDNRNTDFLALDMSTGQSHQQQQQLQLVEQQDNYIHSRASAIESIESTISELGNIFQQLATMVAEQRETVQRIDANTEEIQNHVEGAQKELLKYYASISSNRWLVVKIFAKFTTITNNNIDSSIEVKKRGYSQSKNDIQASPLEFQPYPPKDHGTLLSPLQHYHPQHRETNNNFSNRETHSELDKPIDSNASSEHLCIDEKIEIKGPL
ncbi:12318_t:CDS:10 [Entrophospora sp. SA101]|nr:6655_t:CDS:10 [Entrophospora sp. SA101]CAJ0831954.1 12318_t:CDS:10 [Entrophospora sp. SA101]